MTQRIAIVGAGIAGMTAAHLLSRAHDVVVYEANDYIGGHSHTVKVGEAGLEQAVDTGFIVYNTRTYPNFCRLLDQLGVATQESDMSFSFRDDAADLEYGVPELGKLLAQKRNLMRPDFWRMIRDTLRFYRQAPRLLDSVQSEENLDLRTYLKREGYSQAFMDWHLFPMAESIWSGARRSMHRFPAAAFVRFSHNHGLLTLTDRPVWRTVTGGAVRYVERITAPYLDRIRLKSPVTGIRREPGRVWIKTPVTQFEAYDAVVLACHADQALAMLEAPTELEREILSAFPYAENDVVLHGDTGIMPRRRAAWASWNYHQQDDPERPAALTYDMNRLQSLPESLPLLVTLNRTQDLNPEFIHRRFRYAHPQYDTRAMRQQRRQNELNGQNNTYFCGAYWGYGFHEDGVNSALAVARRFGQEL